MEPDAKIIVDAILAGVITTLVCFLGLWGYLACIAVYFNK